MFTNRFIPTPPLRWFWAIALTFSIAIAFFLKFYRLPADTPQQVALHYSDAVEGRYSGKVHQMLDPEFGAENVAVALTCRISDISCTSTTVQPRPIFTWTDRTVGSSDVVASIEGLEHYSGPNYVDYSTHDMHQAMAGGCMASTSRELGHVGQVNCSVTLHADLQPGERVALQRTISAALGASPQCFDQVEIRTTRRWQSCVPYRFQSYMACLGLLGLLALKWGHTTMRR